MGKDKRNKKKKRVESDEVPEKKVRTYGDPIVQFK